MPLITLTTDWQSRDYYSGMMKGRLSRLIPGAQILDLTHSIEAFHVIQAAFMLRQSLPEFPAGTIHLFLVNQGHQSAILPVVAMYREQFLVGWDDGILALVMESEPDYYLRLNEDLLKRMDAVAFPDEVAHVIHPSFPELSMFPRIVRYITSGKTLAEAGPDLKEFDRPNPWLPVLAKDQIDGQVIFIDGYGNAVSNITRNQFEKTGMDRSFEITIKSNRYRIYTLSNSYMDTDPGELIAIFNSSAFLEIAIVQGDASGLLGLEPGSPIKIKFDYEQQRRSATVFQTTA